MLSGLGKLKYLLLASLFFLALPAKATHLVGGYLTYRYLGTSGNNTSYRVTLYVYRDCSKDGTAEEVPFDRTITLCVYRGSDRSLFNSWDVDLKSEIDVKPVGNTSCPQVANACLKQGIYETNIVVPNSNFGYHLKWERCCRNTQNNLPDGPGGDPYQGQTYYGFIPATSLRNSSPVFQDVPVPFICANDTTTIRNRAIDANNDSLSYRFVTPWQGASSNQPTVDVCPGSMNANINVDYNPGFDATRPFGTGGIAQIDKLNGLTTYLSRNTGRYAVAIEVTEYRNGIAISTIRLDLQILVVNCPPNNKPRLSYSGSTGNIWTVEAGETICRTITGSDLDNQNVTLRGFGDILSGTNGYTGTRATLNPNVAAGFRTARTEFCWKTDCNLARPEPYVVTFEAVDDGCPSKFINQNVLIYVRPFNPLENINGPAQVCQNTLGSLYTATNPVGGRTYEWEVEGGTIVSGQGTSQIRVDWGNTATGKVKLTVISQFGCRGPQKEYDVTLVPSPSKPSINGRDTVCLNTTENYTSTAAPNVTYSWSAVGGNILGSTTGNNVNVRWNQQGQGWLTLTVTNAQGCSSLPDTLWVFVSHPGTPTISGPTSVCPNNNRIQYRVPSNPGSTYRWTIQGGTQASGGNGPTITVNWGAQGIGFVKVQEVNRFGCVGDTGTLQVTKDYTLAGQLPQGDTNVCAFTRSVPYTVNSVSGETYSWIVTGGTIINGQGTRRILVDWGNAGTGSVGVFATAWDSVNNRQCRSAIRAIIVNVRPVPTRQVIVGPYEVCQSTPAGTYSVAGFPNSTFLWEVDGIPNFTGQGTNTIQIPYDTFGTFTIRVRETTQYGCIGPINDTTITIHPKPRTTPLQGEFTICFPRLTNYTYSVTGFPASTYTWGAEAGTINGSNVGSSINVDWSGQAINRIWVFETSSFGCKGDTLQREVFVDNPQVVHLGVTVNPPPGDDKSVWVYFRLTNAPRYNQSLVIQRRPEGSAGSFATIGFANAGDTSYQDRLALTDSTSYQYRVLAINLCGDTLNGGNHTDILLKGRRVGAFSTFFTYTPYKGWAGGVARYEVYRLLEDKSGYQLYATYSDTGQQLMENGLDHFGQWYRVKAYEQGGLQRVSWSNDIKIYFEPVMYVPNAFTPGKKDNLNDRFRPVVGGLKDYKMTVYSRWGEKLWETNNMEFGWDGMYGDKPAQADVYVYIIEYSDFRNKQFEARGTFHLLR